MCHAFPKPIGAPRAYRTISPSSAIPLIPMIATIAAVAVAAIADPPARPRPRSRPTVTEQAAPPPVDPARIPELLEELGVSPIEVAPEPAARPDELLVRVDPALVPEIKRAREAGGRPRVLLLWTTDPPTDRSAGDAAGASGDEESAVAAPERSEIELGARFDPLVRVLEPAPHPVHAFMIESIDADGIATLVGGGAFPGPIDEFDGTLVVTAVLELDEGRFPLRALRASGRSPAVVVSLARDRIDRLAFELAPTLAEPTDDSTGPDDAQRSPASEVPADDGTGIDEVERSPNLVAVRVPSRTRRGHEHRAWAALPQGFDDLNAPRRIWPMVIVAPGDDDPAARAEAFARLLAVTTDHLVMPQAVWVVLDHATARAPALLLDEFLPWLDVRFRIDARPEAHLLVGTGWGGRRALDLLLRAPDRFGKAWAITPALLDVRTFIGVDLLRPTDVYRGEDGLDRPMRRAPLGPLHDRIELTWREAVERGRVLSPSGRAGLPHDRVRRLVLADGDPMRDAAPIVAADFGLIDVNTTRPLAALDVASRLAEAARAGDRPFLERFTILCGDRDSWYRDFAVRRLAETLDVPIGRGEAGAPLAPIELFEEATTDTIGVIALPRLHRGIEAWLVEHELD